MAIVQNPLIGQASGSVRGLTFQHYNGKNIIRRKPFTQTTERTMSQIENQDKFKSAIVRMLDTFPFLPDYIYPYQIRTRSKRTQFQLDMLAVGNKNNELPGPYTVLGNIGNAKEPCLFIPHIDLVYGPSGLQRVIFQFDNERPSDPSFYPHYFLSFVFNTSKNEFNVAIIQYLNAIDTYDFFSPSHWEPIDNYVFTQMDLGKQTEPSTSNSRMICIGVNQNF